MYTTEWNVIGHEWAVAHLTASLQAGRLSHAYLFSGPAGIGKTRFARAFAEAICCTHPDIKPCGRCRACLQIEESTYADFTMIEPDEKGKIGVEQIRALNVAMQLRPMESRYRVIVLHRFDTATESAMDAFLKTLEEPPSHAILMLNADTIDALLPTIRSRCQPINLRLLPIAQIRETLAAYFDVPADRAALLANLSGGRIGWAIRAAQEPELTSGRDAALRELESAVTQSRVGRFMVADGLTKDAFKDRSGLVTVLEAWQSYWRDVLLVQHHATTPLVNRDHEHAIRQIATATSTEQTMTVLKGLSRTFEYVDRNVNPRLAVEVLMLDMPRLSALLPPAP